nr:3-oxoacyl-ACP reductase family protein [uncultured Anaeromusa sp.]
MMLQNACALVTGAGQGIGKEIALALAREGCAVAVNDLYAERAKAVVDAISATGGKAVIAEGNVAAGDAVRNMVETTVAQLGKLDILVNNAGMILKTPFWDITEKDWDTIMAVNLKSVFLCCQAAAPYMRAQKSGKIINIASVAGKVGGGLLGNTAYAASKAGVIAVTKGLARELGPYGVNVNAITPALTETDMTKDISPEKRAQIISNIPLGRPGKPEDIANAVLFLASPLASFVNAEIMDVDGGFMRD